MSETKAVLGARMRQSYSSWPERLGEAAGWGGELMTWKWERGLAAAGKREEELPCSPKGSSQPGGWGVRLRERGVLLLTEPPPYVFCSRLRGARCCSTWSRLFRARPSGVLLLPRRQGARFLIGKPGSERQREQVLT